MGHHGQHNVRLTLGKRLGKSKADKRCFMLEIEKLRLVIYSEFELTLVIYYEWIFFII